MPVLHAQAFLETLEAFANKTNTIANLSEGELAYSVMFFEAADAKAGIIKRDVHFAKSSSDTILSGPHIGVANPRFKTSRRVCTLNSDYDSIDLTEINESYRARCNYNIACANDKYIESISDLPWGGKYHDCYRIGMRKMLNLSGERTLVAAIIPPKAVHIDGIYSMTFKEGLPTMAGCMASLPYDFYIKVTGKANGCYNIFSSFPMLHDTSYSKAIACRALRLNCLTKDYSALWNKEFIELFKDDA